MPAMTLLMMTQIQPLITQLTTLIGLIGMVLDVLEKLGWLRTAYAALESPTSATLQVLILDSYLINFGHAPVILLFQKSIKHI